MRTKSDIEKELSGARAAAGKAKEVVDKLEKELTEFDWVHCATENISTELTNLVRDLNYIGVPRAFVESVDTDDSYRSPRTSTVCIRDHFSSWTIIRKFK